MAQVRVAFASKLFASNQQVDFKIYDKDNNLVHQSLGNEWANTGVYYVEANLSFSNKRVYIVIATELNGTWKATKLINKYDQL